MEGECVPTPARLLLIPLFALVTTTAIDAGTVLSTADPSPKSTENRLLPAAVNNQWYWLNPWPTGVDLRDVVYASPDTVFAVGEATVLRSIDGGYNWRLLANPTSQLLRAVSFPEPLIGVAVGSSGTILRTIDGGLNWTEQSSGTVEDLEGVCFTDALSGTAVGDAGVILRTTDGGLNWTPQTSGTALPLVDIDFADRATGVIAAANGTILRTTDGGDTWSVHSVDPPQNFMTVAFSNSSTCFVAGGRYVYRSTDRGETWEKKTADPDPICGRGIYSIHFADSLNGMAVSNASFECGSFCTRTTDGGDSWVPLFDGRIAPYYGVAMRDSSIATIVGYQGSIQWSNDAGDSWIPRSEHQVKGNLKDVCFTDSLNGAVTNGSEIYSTDDGGLNWTRSLSANTNILVDLDFIDSDNGFATGGMVFAVTRTGSDGWGQITLEFALVAVSFVDPLTGWGVTSNSVMKTTDGGLNWSEQYSISSGRLRDVSFVTDSIGWVVGGSLTLKTSDGGINWQTSTRSGDLRAVSFYAPSRGVAVGAGGLILQKTTGGIDWIRRSSGTTQDLYDVAMSPDLTGFIGGGFDTLLRTGNGGVSWSRQISMTRSNLYGVDKLGHAVGSSGDILSIIAPPDRPLDPPPPPPPPPIKLFYAALVPDAVRLVWDVNDELLITGFRLIKQGSGVPDVWIPEASKLSPSTRYYDDGDVSPDTSLGYTLVMYLVVGSSINADASIVIPPAPVITDLSATAETERVLLTWQIDSPDMIDGIRLFRNSVGGPDVWLPPQTSFDPGVRAHDDVTVVPDSSYLYTLNVNYLFGEVQSAPLAVTTLPLPVFTELDAIPETQRVTLSWDFLMTAGIEGFHIYRGYPNGTLARIPPNGELPPAARSHVDIGLTEDTRYIYTIVAPLTLGGEVRSDPLTVTTVAFPEISRFEVRSTGKEVVIGWELASYDIVSGFRVRKFTLEGGYEWLPADSVLTADTRAYTDGDVTIGREYSYRLSVYLTMPGEPRSEEMTVTVEPIPSSYSLGQNHPNPFNPGTTIPYTLPESAPVRIEIFDTGGRRVRILVDEVQPPGFRSVNWDGRNDTGDTVASGVYFCRIQAGDFSATHKMVLVR